MVGLFSRFSVSRAAHRRTQSALDEREVLPPNLEETDATSIGGASSVVPYGIEFAYEFKPVEHPPEPLDIDWPTQCPLPEPSVLNVRMEKYGRTESLLCELESLIFPLCRKEELPTLSQLEQYLDLP
ncbi:uncharacterized protein LOC132640121 isoform X2 [Lycium barbarum]|uniref:uncharacterized protein LOC132640121 isoform X2 n=1 Tax=Lycium barbarum TaxID=112863 RepID=UPI00293F6FC4|nr:uncharacterized protein LOC132640121 isoform X2 [Lycium barbarum]